MFKVATWNVNSLRVRLQQVLDWLQANQPDVLALQETKIPDALFPLTEIRAAGYECVFTGQPSYNGVAILSREPVTDVMTNNPLFEDPQRRVLAVTLKNGIRLLNLYVPNGESVESVKFQYKLNWMKHLNSFLKEELKRYPKLVIMGDFNVAPDHRDIYDPAAFEGKVLCSDHERSAFQSTLDLGFHDSFRLFEQPEKSFTWWDYRLNGFKRNLGARIDHILVSEALLLHCKSCQIDKNPRALERPSDHTILMAHLEVG